MQLIVCRNPLKRKGIGKTLLMMKLTAVFLLAVCLNASANGFAQKVSVSEKNASIERIFKEIKKQTGYTFVYTEALLKKAKKVTLNLNNASLEQVLDVCFQNQPLTYSILNKMVIIKERDLAQFKEQISISLPPPVHIQGKIVNDKEEPLVGATITEKGTNNSTTTKEDGGFALNVANEKSVLIISFVGYESKEVMVGNQTALTVQLVLQNRAMNEIVVVGYGTQRKGNLTGAVNTLKMDDLSSRPLTNTSVALQGQMPGVYALQMSGKAGGDAAVINIRGVGTLNNSDPLVLVDGFPASINDVNPMDIESVSVLKDAASASIYGNRAANGVILITTKKGANRKVKLSYNNYFGVQSPTSLPKTLNSVQWATLYNEAAVNSGQQPKYTAEQIQKFASGTDPLYPNADWFGAFYRNASIQNHHLNINGGSENLNYAFMFGYLDQEGILEGNNYERFTFRSNFDAFFMKNKRLKLSAKLFGSKGDQNQPADEWGAKWYATNGPIHPIRNAKGEWAAVIGERNVLAEIKEGSIRNELRNQFNGIFGAEYKIINGLSAELSYGYNWIQYLTKTYNANLTLDKLDGSYKTQTANLREENAQDLNTLLTALLRYNKKIGNHNISALAGYSQEEFRFNKSEAYRSGFVNNSQQYLGLGNASTQTNNGGAWDLGLESYFGRLGYTFNDRYLFEANIRRDGSSRFAENLRWGTFPSFSAGWRISEEFFMQNVSWLNDLKIRGSWGKLGNQNIGTRYAASEVLTSGRNYILGGNLVPGVAITSLANKETTWETTTQTNAGVDVTLLKNISFTADYFWKNTDDILMQIPIPITMGAFSPPFQNVGKVKNEGFEFSVNYRKTFTNDLKFSATANVSHITNQITDLYGRSPIITGVKALVEGYAVNALYGYEVDGLYQISDFTWQNGNDPNIPHADRQYVLKDKIVTVANFSAKPGDLKFKDLNGDGRVTMDKDRKVIGKQFPDYSYSTQFNLDWKGFDLGMFLQGVQGIEGYGYFEIYKPFSGFAGTGAWWQNRWTPENPNTSYYRLTLDDTRRDIHSTFYTEDASYFRLKNIELGYTLPSSVLQKVNISKVRVYGNVQNVFTISNFKGFDPEQPTWETRAQAYPQTRIVTFGVNVNF